MKPKLIYDQSCPICVNYVRMIRNKIGSDKLDLEGGGSDADEFTYVTASGETLMGNVAITRFAEDFPDILSYFWMLPSKFKSKALQAAYTVGSAARNLIKKSGCNCGRK